MNKLLLFLLLALPALGGRDFVSASSQLGVCSVDPISPPFTIFAFGYANQSTASAVLMSIGTTTNATERIQILFGGATAGDPIFLSAVSASGSSSDSTNSFPYITTNWMSVGAVVSSATSRTLYINGSSAATGTTSVDVNGLNQVILGARKNTTYGVFWSGVMAECSVWDVALSSDEVLSLSFGSSPFLIRPANLKFYAPLTGRETTSEWNLVGAAVSLTNSPAASALHPRIYRP